MNQTRNHNRYEKYLKQGKKNGIGKAQEYYESSNKMKYWL